MKVGKAYGDDVLPRWDLLTALGTAGPTLPNPKLPILSGEVQHPSTPGRGCVIVADVSISLPLLEPVTWESLARPTPAPFTPTPCSEEFPTAAGGWLLLRGGIQQVEGLLVTARVPKLPVAWPEEI